MNTRFCAIVEKCAADLGIDFHLAQRLIVSIDVSKMKGYTGGEAASRFGDQLGFLRIPDNRVSHEVFAERWTDHKVWSPVNEELKKYLNSETPLFTQSRLEPVSRTRPFYQAGVTQTLPGNNYNPEDGSAVRKAPPLPEDYSNFIIHEFLPEHFFLEVPNSQVRDILVHGLPETNYDAARKIYLTDAEARINLTKDLITKGIPASRANLIQYTLLTLRVSAMQMNNTVFYTKTVSGHKGQGSNYGYFYTGTVSARGCQVAKTNISE